MSHPQTERRAPNGSEVDIDDFWNLTESGVGGGLAPSNSSTTAPGPPFNPDGSWTAIWSNPQLANLNLTFVTIEGNQQLDAFGNGVYDFFGSFYFPGYAPFVSITNPGVEEDGYEIGPIAPVQIDARVVGGADAETNAEVINPPGITGYTATGLPPGLSINRIGQISGTPTGVGTFDVTVSATGQYNYGTQDTSASTSFQWVIDPPPPAMMPTNYNGDHTRPGVVMISPTGAFFLAGYSSKRIRGRLPRYGRLRWTKWTATDGWATGGLWMDNCTPDCASGTYHAVRASVHVYLQNFLWSMFTRMTVYPARQRSFTLRAYQRKGVWYWH
jgi:Putative Ig domain